MKSIGKQEMDPSKIIISPELKETQKFMPISKDDRDRLKDDIQKTGHIREPLKVYREKGKFYLLAGWNRLEIAKEIGFKTIPIEEMEGTKKEYSDFTISDNLNRRHLGREEKENLIKYLIKKDPSSSSRKIGKQTGADHKTVESKRKEMESSGEIPHVPRKDSLNRLIPSSVIERIPMEKALKKYKKDPSILPILQSIEHEFSEIEEMERKLKKHKDKIAYYKKELKLKGIEIE